RQDECARGRNAGCLRADRRMEGPPGGGHFLGWRERPLWQTRRPKAGREARLAEGGRGLNPVEHRQAKANSTQGSQWLLDRYGARAVLARLPTEGVATPQPP